MAQKKKRKSVYSNSEGIFALKTGMSRGSIRRKRARWQLLPRRVEPG